MKSERLDYRVGWKGNEGTACYHDENGLFKDIAGYVSVNHNLGNFNIQICDSNRILLRNKNIFVSPADVFLIQCVYKIQLTDEVIGKALAENELEKMLKPAGMAKAA